MRQARLLGIPIKAVVYGNSHGVVAPSPQGREGMFYIAYYSSTGGALIGYQAQADELVTVKLPSSGGYGCTVGTDGALYIGGIMPGNLYRYGPGGGEVENLGGSEFGVQYIWATAASPEGKVYAACYPTCSVLEYDIEKNELRDLGQANDSEQYVRSICVDHRGKVWAGVGNRAHLVVLDPQTGERHDVLPAEYAHNSTVYDLAASGNYVLASVLYDGKLLVFDADTEDLVRVVPQPRDSLSWMNAHGAPPGEAYLYSTPSGDLYHYSIEADELKLLAPGLGQCEQVVDGRYVHGISDQDYFLYDLGDSQELHRGAIAEAADGMHIQTLTGALDGNVYGSTYINQHMFRLDTETEELTDLGKVIRLGGQVDSIHAGRDGKVYMGSYVHATLSIYDPSRPWAPSRELDGNPRELGMVGHGQYRTQATVLGPGGDVWVGSIPSYNSAPTGALSRWDPETGEHQSWLDLVAGGGIYRIAADDRYLYCSGGGRFFVWDPQTESKVHEDERTAYSLVVTPAGKILGNSGEGMFVFDPAEMRVSGTFPAPIGRMDSMALAPNGLVYGINDAGIAEIDTAGETGRKVSDAGGHLIATDTAGGVYFARGAALYCLDP